MRSDLAAASGAGIDRKDILWYRAKVLELKSEQYPSGAQDIKNKRITEVDFLDGAVVRKGRELGVPTPVNETIARLARVRQSTHDNQF